MKEKSQSGRRYSWTDAFIALSLVILTYTAFESVQENDFVYYDDHVYITENPQVQAGVTATSLWWDLTAFHASNWHPLTWLSLQLDYERAGLNPAAYHLTNLALHILNAVLLYLLLRNWTGAMWPSTLVAFLFALHPLHVESVAWASERKDVLSTFFWFLTLCAYGRYVRTPSLGGYLLVLGTFVLGLLAKPMLVTLPFVLLLLDYWPLGRVGLGQANAALRKGETKKSPLQSTVPVQHLVKEKLPLILLAAASCMITMVAQQRAIRHLEDYSMGSRIGNALISYLNYIGKMFWPINLTVFYPHPKDTVEAWQAAAAAAVLIGFTMIALYQSRRRPYLIVGWLWYIGTLVPVIGLVQVGFQSMADRYTYVPLVGLFIISAWGLADLTELLRCPPVLARAVAGLIVISAAILTWLQVHYWQDTFALWAHACEVTPHSNVAYLNLGLEFGKQQRPDIAVKYFESAAQLDPNDQETSYNLGLAQLKLGMLDEAINNLTHALRLKPDDADSLDSLGTAYRQQGYLQEAIECHEKALRLDPEHFPAHNNLGVALCLEGKYAAAIEHLDMAIHLNDRSADAYSNKGLALALSGNGDQAIACYRRAAELRPDVARYQFDLAFEMHQSGKLDAAKEIYRNALRLEPTWPETTNMAAWLLAVNDNDRLRNGKLAVRMAEQVTQAAGNREPRFLDTLAAAYAENGQFVKAIAQIKHAIETAHESGHEQAAKKMLARLHLYEKLKPYRETVANQAKNR